MVIDGRAIFESVLMILDRNCLSEMRLEETCLAMVDTAILICKSNLFRIEILIVIHILLSLR